ncbi:hypothetical protein [Bacillus subtilis]|uniref:hypothetical protein n=1 Tax=Bacillus subtilis TaxID=1423 RepID=UPI0015E70165|nr:hypothetical protein [Bacillus subtilis]
MNKEKNEMQQEGFSELKVLKSAAGFYVGTELTEDGVTMPYSRESSYFRTENAAKEELKKRTAKDPTVNSSLENKSNSTTKERQITNQPLFEIEKALESEKEKHDKMQAKESGPKTRMEKRNQKRNKKFRSNDYER